MSNIIKQLLLVLNSDWLCCVLSRCKSPINTWLTALHKSLHHYMLLCLCCLATASLFLAGLAEFCEIFKLISQKFVHIF